MSIVSYLILFKLFPFISLRFLTIALLQPPGSGHYHSQLFWNLCQIHLNAVFCLKDMIIWWCVFPSG
jgi:hypothetical protein